MEPRTAQPGRDAMDNRTIIIVPGRIAWCLGLVAALLVAGNVALQMARLAMGREYLPGMALVTLDGENNIPALFSTALLAGSALLLGFIGALERDRQARDARRWLLLSAGFVLMALDESLALHERLIDPVRGLLGGRDLGVLYFAWVLPAIALAGALGLFFLPFLLRLPRRTAVAFAVAAAIYLGGAVGVELPEGLWRESHGHRNAVYHLLVSLEEGLEMAGIVLFIHALLEYLGRHHPDLRLQFGKARETAARPQLDSSALASPAGD
jgi:hypothetical protein